jgi:cytochrome c5
VAEVPQAIAHRFGGAPAMLERGSDRYDIYCRPCHDGTGAGRGTVVTRAGWQPPPPTFHQDRIRQMPDGQLFATITHGIRTMPSYGATIPVNDRWAIVSYVRALQLSRGEATP